MTGAPRLGAGGCRRQVAFRRAAGRPGSGGARPCQLNLDTQEDAFTHTVLAAVILLMCSREGCRISVENIVIQGAQVCHWAVLWRYMKCWASPGGRPVLGLGRLVAGTVGSNPDRGMDVCLCVVLCR
jgi:hypothetical protein